MMTFTFLLVVERLKKIVLFMFVSKTYKGIWLLIDTDIGNYQVICFVTPVLVPDHFQRLCLLRHLTLTYESLKHKNGH